MNTGFPGGLRYYPLSAHYRRRFGARVYKLGVSIAQSCPNREGIRGMEACVFCDQWGSAAYPERAHLSLGGQIAATATGLRARYKAERFLIYFQAYTNTFQRMSRLEALLDEALAAPDVVGVVVGTRPDCLPRTALEIMARVARSHYLSVELGLQTLDDGQLRFLARGHDSACSLKALEQLGEYPEIEVCAHLMFGLPGENDAQLRETAAVLSRYDIQGVKLHNLHVLKNTPLQGLYARGEFQPVERAEYARKVGIFLEHLSPRVAVHRLNAVASRWDEVVAPEWVKAKMETTQFIRDHLEQVDTWQGKHYASHDYRAAATPSDNRTTYGQELWG